MLTVNAGVLRTARTIEFSRFKVQEQIGPGFVELEIRHVAICGSDVDYWRYNGKVPPDYILIHEVGAVVTEVGKGVHNLHPGDTVWVNPLWTDITEDGNRCLHEIGYENLIPLPHHRFLGTPPVQGALRDRMIYPADLCHRIKGGKRNPELIPLIEPLACSINGADLLVMERVRMYGDEWTAAVIGPGPIGLMCAAILLERGCSRVFMLGRTQGRLAKVKDVLAQHFDADRIVNIVNNNGDSIVDAVRRRTPNHRGTEVVMECSGAEEVLSPAMQYLSPMGQVVEVGRMLHGIHFERPHGQRGQKAFHFSYRFNRKAIASAIEHLFGPRPMNLEGCITNRFGLQDADKAFYLAAEKPPEVIKVLITNGK